MWSSSEIQNVYSEAFLLIPVVERKVDLHIRNVIDIEEDKKNLLRADVTIRFSLYYFNIVQEAYHIFSDCLDADV